jgi:hypothetical protein
MSWAWWDRVKEFFRTYWVAVVILVVVAWWFLRDRVQQLLSSELVAAGQKVREFDEKAKEENQLAIIDAFLPYGFGVVKNGYNSRTGKAKLPSILTGEKEANYTNMEHDLEYIKYEKSTGVRVSPKFSFLDS